MLSFSILLALLAIASNFVVGSRRTLLTISKEAFHRGAGIAGEGSVGVSIALTFNRTFVSEEDIQLNRTAAERANKACEKIEVISEAIEVLYAFASESEPSKVAINQIVCSTEGLYLTVRFLSHLTNSTIDSLLDISNGGPRLMAKTLSPFGLRLVEASISEEPKDDKEL